MHAIQGWMCGVDFTCELGEADGGNIVYPTKENLLANRTCARPDGDKMCAPAEVFVVSREDFKALLDKAGINPSEVRVANWGTENFDDVLHDLLSV